MLTAMFVGGLLLCLGISLRLIDRLDGGENRRPSSASPTPPDGVPAAGACDYEHRVAPRPGGNRSGSAKPEP